MLCLFSKIDDNLESQQLNSDEEDRKHSCLLCGSIGLITKAVFSATFMALRFLASCNSQTGFFRRQSKCALKDPQLEAFCHNFRAAATFHVFC